jgi:hypothetical protein
VLVADYDAILLTISYGAVTASEYALGIGRLRRIHQ